MEKEISNYDIYLKYLERIEELQGYEILTDKEDKELELLRLACHEYETKSYGF